MIKVEMLPAGHGDALLVEYGEPAAVNRILVDGGPYFTYDTEGGLRRRLMQLRDQGETTFELLIVTHVDTDHIDSIIRLLQDPELDAFEFRDIWFNGWKHLQPKATGVLAGLHGEYLGALLDHQKRSWNAHPELGGGPIMVPAAGPLPVLPLVGDATATLLSPGPTELEALRSEWPKSLNRFGFRPGDTQAALASLKYRARYGPPRGVLGAEPDDRAANGSSIAIVLRHGDDQILLAGDAWAPVLEQSLKRYPTEHPGPLQVRDFKLPHHGSFSNLSRNLVKAVCPVRYLISSSSQYHDHPDTDAIELILKHHEGGKPELVFNYRSPQTLPWADTELQERRGYTTSFATNATWGL